MWKYIQKRLASALLAVFIVLTLNFVIISIAPGNPIKTLMGKDADNPTLRAALEKKYGLDQPLMVRYFKYLGNVVRGDLGKSIIYNESVAKMILSKVGPTVLLVLTASTFSLLIGTALGILAARKEGGVVDGVISGINYILNSLPSFWLGLMLIIVFATRLKWFPTYGMVNARADLKGWAYIVDVLQHLFLPLLTLVLIELPIYFRIAKSSVLQVTEEDFVTTFRAAGMDERKLFRKYIFKNAILPTITIFGISLAYLITGVALIEIVFAWPGTGRLVLNAINQRDYPVIMGMYLITSVSIALMMLFIDILYAVVDPRIRY
ncbi:MAG: ABC transporter permease [Anaerolineaceae bacterium]|nr:ABC transporter permease [Anaerolineaceae bacterium]